MQDEEDDSWEGEEHLEGDDQDTVMEPTKGAFAFTVSISSNLD